MTAKTCPSCGLVNPSSAERCDCGYDFPSGQREEVEEERHIKRDRSHQSFRPGCLTVFLALAFLGYVFSFFENKPKQTSSNQPASIPGSYSSLTPSKSVASWETDLEIVDFNWSLSEFSVATWKLRVRNKSKTKTYKDLHFKTVYFAPSGTKVDESFLGHTEYVVVPPGKTVSINFTEFAHSQAQRARLSIDGAKIY